MGLGLGLGQEQIKLSGSCSPFISRKPRLNLAPGASLVWALEMSPWVSPGGLRGPGRGPRGPPRDTQGTPLPPVSLLGPAGLAGVPVVSLPAGPPWVPGGVHGGHPRDTGPCRCPADLAGVPTVSPRAGPLRVPGRVGGGHPRDTRPCRCPADLAGVPTVSPRAGPLRVPGRVGGGHPRDTRPRRCPGRVPSGEVAVYPPFPVPASLRRSHQQCALAQAQEC